MRREKTDLANDKEDLEAASDSNEQKRAALLKSIGALKKSIKDLDHAVAEATEQRKNEAAEFKELMQSDTVAKELLKFAMNRLNKFYNPALYKPPPKRELTDEERATLAAGGTLAPTPTPGGIAGTGIGLSQVKPPPPPETFEGDYKKKGEESNGVIAMIKTLIADLDKEMTEAKAEEKNAQEDYAEFTKESTAKRDEDSKSLATAQSALAEAQEEAVDIAQSQKENAKNTASNQKKTAAMHGDCDWLVKFYDLRKESRANEVDALGKAKAVLSGANYA